MAGPDERIAFYLHFMRRSGEAPAVADREMPLLIQAYRRLLPVIDLPGAMARRHTLLFLFGFDEAGALPSGETQNVKTLKARLKTLAQTGKYTSLPAQRQKQASFLAYAEEAPRLLQTLRHLGYRHDRRGGDAYDTVNLVFWGMVLIILSDAATRAQLLADMLDGGYDLPQRDRHLGILHRTVCAVLADCPSDETEFHALAQRLAMIERARREASEAAVLARSLDLPFEDDEDWTVRISIAEQGSGRSALLPPNLVLRPTPPRTAINPVSPRSTVIDVGTASCSSSPSCSNSHR